MTQLVCTTSTAERFAKTVTRILVAVTVGLVAGCMDEKDEFLVALANIPRSNTDQTSGVTRVVQERIPPGSDLKTALLFLEQRGFSVNPYRGKNVPQNQQWLTAERKQSYKIIHTETIRVIVESDGKQILNTRGQFFLSGF